MAAWRVFLADSPSRCELWNKARNDLAHAHPHAHAHVHVHVHEHDMYMCMCMYGCACVSSPAASYLWVVACLCGVACGADFVCRLYSVFSGTPLQMLIVVFRVWFTRRANVAKSTCRSGSGTCDFPDPLKSHHPAPGVRAALTSRHLPQARCVSSWLMADFCGAPISGTGKRYKVKLNRRTPPTLHIPD